MIGGLDHLVLTVRDLGATRDFYVRGLGFRQETPAEGRVALIFDRHKFNLHESDVTPILPPANKPTPGSADFCRVADRPLSEVIVQLTIEAFPSNSDPWIGTVP